MESSEIKNTNSTAYDATITWSGVNTRFSTGDFAQARLAESKTESQEPVASRSYWKLRVEKHIELLTDAQIETRQISKNRYTELEAWRVYQLFFEYPQLFFGYRILGRRCSCLCCVWTFSLRSFFQRRRHTCCLGFANIIRKSWWFLITYWPESLRSPSPYLFQLELKL